MSKIKIVAFEDEDLHAEKLKMLADMMGYQLLAILNTSEGALGKIAALQPDIILMDINLGEEKTGIDIAREINQLHDLPIIFVTSFRDLATLQQAMKAEPEAYLTKPYDAVNLQAAIEIAVKKNMADVSRINPNAAEDEIFLKENAGWVKVKLEDILYIEAYDKYCYIHTCDRKILHNVMLKEMLQKLPAQFVQTHRSFVVNQQAIERVLPLKSKVEIKGKLIPVSRTFKKSLFYKLKMV